MTTQTLHARQDNLIACIHDLLVELRAEMAERRAWCQRENDKLLKSYRED